MESLQTYLNKIDYQNVPRHIAIIMDGNGRWAKSRALPRIAGHRAGVEAIKRVSEISQEIGIEIITMFAFSTENWKRPKKEVEFLMSLPKEYLKKELQNLKENNIKITIMGDTSAIPAKTLEVIEQGVEETKNNTALNLNFALNYGGRAEIVQAVRKIAAKASDREIDPKTISEDIISQHLYNPEIPDPDLMIRSSGEQRLSNFLLWQLAYSELWFPEVYWPDFQKEHLLQAVLAYQNRERKFGGVNS
ncbi:isoprenyl transferase [Natranaerobius thermophilus]|uniref:Isoprenyl transferase n=1 Tax=Natranaerobius thermophilus (strain ATCC BAA-1301 / DSM 18059 / JW/NM-WN-LF) TaxID=457570 RepID=B2A386_NATTJ|nr:isoprenyl transferase [Natranaerobius thermophilus]ACB85016.1 Undecaprenyl pyrophosphate synthetase [Natranaerobius thermophilus JW/NM-WN-LF]